MQARPIFKSKEDWQNIFAEEQPNLLNFRTNAAAAKYLANKYGMSPSTMTVYLYMYRGKIKDKPVHVTSNTETPVYTSYTFNHLPTSTLRTLITQLEELISSRENTLLQEVEALKRKCQEQGIDLRNILE